MPLRMWKDALFAVPALSILTPQDDISDLKYAAARRRCSKYMKQKMQEIGCPGLVIGVSINGKNVWTKGFGYADLENNVPCKPDTVMRIASISKSLTMAAVAKLIENGKLKISEPVQKYVPDFPIKKFNGKDVAITTEMLLSHTSGIRHYNKTNDKDKDQSDDLKYDEFYSMKPYQSVTESLNMFKDDPLVHKPGEKYLYTTHGWTLVSAVVEGASGEDFVYHMQELFRKFGMKSTYAESTKKIIYNRSRHYVRTAKGRLENVPFVDLSYKWAGGGFVSTVPDLLKFGNVMLHSYQSPASSATSFLKKETVRMIWTPMTKIDRKPYGKSYGFGWVVYPKINEIGCGLTRDYEVAHTGGAVGASSVLYICPQDETQGSKCENISLPNGIVVAAITNLQSVGLTKIARDIANEFRSAVM